MKRTLIRYKTKPDLSDRNAELIAAVFAELKAAKPDGVRYLSLRLDDDTFIHLVEAAADDGSSALPRCTSRFLQMLSASTGFAVPAKILNRSSFTKSSLHSSAQRGRFLQPGCRRKDAAAQPARALITARL